MADSAGSHRYHFNCSGFVKEIVFPNKAILSFKMHGKEERALLLSKTLSIDGKPIDETCPLANVLKVNDLIHFDCHIYDKGGVGSGKDKCSFYAMKAWKNSPDYENTKSTTAGSATTNGTHSSNTKFGTGWISELHPRKGVLTFDNNGVDERVLMLASKVYFFEKRIGAKQPLNHFFNEGDPVQFEAVPQEGNADNPANSYCPWFATLVWKGKRPSVESSLSDSPYSTVTAANSQAAQQAFSYYSQSPASRSCDSSSSSEDGEESSSFLIMTNNAKNGHGNPGVIKGVGVIAKFVNDRSGVIWWYKRHNELQSVWFLASKTFLYGVNLAGKAITEHLNEGDAVTFLAERSPVDCPTKWVAKQVLINEETTGLLQTVKTKPIQKDEAVLL